MSQDTNLVAVVKVLHWRHSSKIHKLIKDDEELSICYNSGVERLPQKISVEKTVQLLPLNLIAVLISSEEDDKFQYLLCGIRLLQSLFDLTSRIPKLDQLLHDDVRLTAQMMDLVFLTMMVNGGNTMCNSDDESLIDATLVASSLYLMHGVISPDYQNLAIVLLACPRVDVFIVSVFGAIHNVVRSLKGKLVNLRTDLPKKLNAVCFHCQQAEAALQFLHFLCQYKQFRDRIAKSKELCENGGALMLAQSILSLTVRTEFAGATAIIASISRMKAKVFSILQHLFETESFSFLDEVASAGNLHLAKFIISEVLNLLRLGLSKASKASASPDYPMGFVLLNAMRLADVLTDDSNFRSFFTEHFSMVLSAVFCLSHGNFLSLLCSSDILTREDDAALDYDLFMSVGWCLSVFSTFSRSVAPPFKLSSQNNLTMHSYAHQITSLVIKMIANLHCFVPNLCLEQDRNRFIRNFMSGLRNDSSSILVNLSAGSSFTPVAHRGTGVCRNLSSLLRHADSLIPHVLIVEDFQLFRVFCDQLQLLLRSEFEESQAQNSDVPVEGVSLVTLKKGVKEVEMGIEELLKESDADASNLETSGSDASSNRGKSLVKDGGLVQMMKKNKFIGSASGEVKGRERKRRKRSIMNYYQTRMIEKALAVEPDMQRKSASIQLWADKLSQNGFEVITSSQLKNWLNNRKAKLARANKQTGLVRDNNSSGDLMGSPGDETNRLQKSSKPVKDKAASKTPKTKEITMRSSSSEEGLKRGQQVMLMNERGDEIGKGMVLRTDGEWFGLSLETRQVCVVDVMEFSGLYDWSKTFIPYGSDDVGRTFGEAKSRFGVIRVAWDVNKLQNQIRMH